MTPDRQRQTDGTSGPDAAGLTAEAEARIQGVSVRTIYRQRQRERVAAGGSDAATATAKRVRQDTLTVAVMDRMQREIDWLRAQVEAANRDREDASREREHLHTLLAQAQQAALPAHPAAHQDTEAPTGGKPDLFARRPPQAPPAPDPDRSGREWIWWALIVLALVVGAVLHWAISLPVVRLLIPV